MRAAQHGHLTIVQVLVNKGANVNAIIEGRDHAMMWAAARGHRNIVMYLLQNHAIIELLSNGKYSTIERIHQLIQVCDLIIAM